MTKPTILVTGATGNTGSAVVAELRRQGWPVRAVVRRFDARSRALDRMGADTVVADLFDPEQLLTAMRGTARAYYLPVFDPFMIQGAVAFAAAAREAGLEQVVQMSQWLSSPHHPSLATRQTWLADQLFDMLPGVAHTIVNPGMFADNFLRIIDFPALLGVYPVLTGKGRAAPVANEDIARVVVAALADPARHAGQRYRPTGPTLLSGREMAAVIAGVVGHRVLPVDMPLWLFLKVARMQGVSPFLLSGYRHYLNDVREGAFELDGGVNDTVRALTGAPAEAFEVTARRYAALPFAQPTLGNRLRALGQFMRAPVSPGHNLARYERAQGFPAMPTARSAMASERWQAEHSTGRVTPLRVAA